MEVDSKKGAKASRFSTLRVFKFAKNPPPGPPPLPPKDAVYLAAQNRSLASLSPDSIPSSPLSPEQYALPVASTSAMSLVLPQKKSGLFKFKKSPGPESPAQDDDENISMPWNFQHHVHVDEGMAGLPPSWTTSLQEAGLSDDEIAAIQSRRRPISPAILRPTPRTTSLPKQSHTPASSLSSSSSPAPLSVSSSTELPTSPPPNYEREYQGREREREREYKDRGYTDYSSSRGQSPSRDYKSPSPPRGYRPVSPARAPSPPRNYRPSSPLHINRKPSPPRTQSPSPPLSRSRSPSPQRQPPINAKNLTLDLALDSSTSWSDAVLSAASASSPWPSGSPPASPLFTLTAAPPAPAFGPALSELGSPTLGEYGGMTLGEYARYSIPNSAGAMHLEYNDDPDLLGAGASPHTNRDSDMTMLGVPSPATIVRNVSVARRTVANVVPVALAGGSMNGAPLASPQSSHFGFSSSGSSESQGHQTPTTDAADEDGELDYYMQDQKEKEKERKVPDVRARMMVSATDTFGGVTDEDDEDDGEEEYAYGYEFPPDDELDRQEEEEDEEGTLGATGSVNAAAAAAAIASGSSASPSGGSSSTISNSSGSGSAGRPTVITTRRPVGSPGPLTALGMALTPMTPAQRYAGWVSNVVAPLEEFIDEPADPREFYVDLQEIAEGESGSVYAAALAPGAPHHRLKLPPLVKARDADDAANGRRKLIAIKCVALLPDGSPKLVDVQRELVLLRGLRCEHVLGMDALYVDLVEDALWIRMELMERSLADVVGLVDEGLRLQEPRVIARFASDMLQALDYLQKHCIAHRDLRSDNLLLNSEGVLKLTDFSNAVLVTPESPTRSDPVGVMYWQAPEVLSNQPYDPLKIDVWSVGATVWELAEATPPFSDAQQPAERWPPISDPALYPPAFHDFLRLCSEPAATRPSPSELIELPFIQKACGRPVIVQLLSRCMAIEQALQAGDAPPDSPP